MTPDALSEYRALKDRAAWSSLSDRGKLWISGPDRLTFLQAMITNDVSGLADYEGLYSLFLRSTGKIVADFCCYRFPEGVLLDTEPAVSEHLSSELEKFVVMDDVQITDVSAVWDHFGVHGPGAQEAVFGLIDLWSGEKRLDRELPARAHQVSGFEHAGEQVFVVFRPTLADQGYEVLFQGEIRVHVRSLWERVAAEIPALGREALEAVRIERGLPRFGVDFTTRNNPVEASLQNAISFTKGCYAGQEVVSKATYVGGVSRVLVRLRIPDDAIPSLPAEVTDSSGHRVGSLTSAAYSPDFNAIVAFGYLKRPLSSPGSRCLVAYPSGRLTEAEVIPIRGSV